MQSRLRIVLSGRNNQSIARTVEVKYDNEQYSPSWEIGTVTPVKTQDWGSAWEARDNDGAFHGTWLTDWYAADALLRGMLSKHGKAV